jgi:hypothetical protein
MNELINTVYSFAQTQIRLDELNQERDWLNVEMRSMELRRAELTREVDKLLMEATQCQHMMQGIPYPVAVEVEGMPYTVFPLAPRSAPFVRFGVIPAPQVSIEGYAANLDLFPACPF